MKCVVDRDDISVAMKFEVYPNRDSTVFLDKFGMTDCETFIRGTVRFKGFSAIISSFHDIGITSDDPVGEGVSTLRDLAMWRFTKTPAMQMDSFKSSLIEKFTDGLPQNDKLLAQGLLSRADTSFLNGNERLLEDAFRSIVKTLHFLGFFEDDLKLKVVGADGKRRSCLDAFCDVMASRMAHESHDRDLVVMRHNFVIEDQNKRRWGHTSTWIDSGESH